MHGHGEGGAGAPDDPAEGVPAQVVRPQRVGPGGGLQGLRRLGLQGIVRRQQGRQEAGQGQQGDGDAEAHQPAPGGISVGGHT